MSTVLDALAKADVNKVGEASLSRPTPSGGGPPPGRRGWKVVVFFGLVGAAFIVGMFGDRSEEVGPTEDPAEVLVVPEAGSGAERWALAKSTQGSPLVVEPGVGQKAMVEPLAARPENPTKADPEALAAPNAQEGMDPTKSAAQTERRKTRGAWRDKQMEARDAARAARGRVLKGEISRDEYRDERRQKRVARKVDRSGNREAQRAAQRETRAKIRKNASPPTVGAVASADTPAPAIVSGPEVAAPLPPQAPVPGVAATSAPSDPPEGHALEIRRWVPSGAPAVRIQILQWSRDDERRFAFLSVDGGRATRVTEGTVVGPLQVKTLYREMIEFEFDGKSFLLRAN